MMSPKSRRREVHPGGPLRGFSPCAEPAVPPRPGTQRRPKSRRANGRPLLEEIMVLFLQVGLCECGSRQMAAFLGLWRQEVRMRMKGRRSQAAAGAVWGQAGIRFAGSPHFQPPLPSHPLSLASLTTVRALLPLCHRGCSISGEFTFQGLSAVFLPPKS